MFVWQIDSAGAVLTPADPPMYPHSSLSGGGLAVSPNGRFVFASGPNALSVWRLNSEAGTLTMTADYREGGQDAAENTITGIAGVFDVVPNADGSLLFVTSAAADRGALSVWRVDNSSGTLVETEVYESTAGENSLGLAAAAGAALSPDGSLLFVGTFASGGILDERDGLSVWRVNAEEGTPTVTHLMTHRDDQRLRRPRYVAVSPSGLLLVSSQISGSAIDPLSIWRADSTGNITSLGSHDNFSAAPGAVGATAEVIISAGLFNNALFLFRINEDGNGASFMERYNHNADAFTYRDGNPNISALQPIGVTASPAGGLVFSGGFRGPVTAWRVEGIPRVPAAATVRVTVNADPAPMAALAVTVEARQGSRAVTSSVTFGPQDTTAQAVFAGGALGPGEWAFTALSASTADVSAARGTVRINSPDVRLENLSGRVRGGENLEIKVIASASLPKDVMVTVRGRRDGTTIMGMGRLSAGQTSLSVPFNTIPEGVWTFSAVPRLPLVTETEADNTTLEVSIRPPLPRLTLLPAAQDFALHSDVVISVSATGALDSDVTVTVSADSGSGSASASLEVMLLRGDGTSPPAAVLARFLAGRLDVGTYTIMAGMASVDDVAADAMTIISVRRAELTLELAEAQLFVSGDAVSIRVLSDLAASASAEIIVRAVQAGQPGTEQTTQATLVSNTSAVQADFGAGILTAGIWTISASGELDVFTLAGDISVEVLAEPILLTLSVDQDRIFPNAAFSVNLALERGLPDDLQVTILATHSVLGSTAESIVSIAPDQNMGSASFSLPVPGVWDFTVFNPHSVLDASSAQASVEVILPMLTLAPTEVEYALDSDVIINVSAMPQMLHRSVDVAVRAEREGTDSSFTRSVSLTESPSSQAVFSGGTLGEGLWNFTAEMPSESGVVAVQGATASAVVRKPVLRFLVSSDTVFVSDGEVRLSAVSDLVPGTRVTITPMAQRQDAPEIQEQGEPTVIAADSTEAEAVFRAGVLSAGEWTIAAASSTPDVFARIVTASVTVQQVPILRLVPEQEDPVPGAPFSVHVIPDRLPLQDVAVTVQARQYGLIKTAAVGLNRSAPFLLESGAAAVFEGPNVLGVGPWMLTVLPTVGVEVPDELVVWVTVQQQVLGLAAEQVGADVHVLLTANFRRAYDLGIEVRAQRGEDRHERELRLLSTSQQGEVVFEGDVLGIGLWTFSVSRIVPGFVIAPSPVTLTLTVTAALAIGTVPQGQVLAGEELGLIQTDIYCRGGDDCSRSRQSSDSPSGSFDFAEAAVVSPDGRMVVVSASRSLHFWRLDPVAGTLNDRQVIRNSQGSANGLEVPNFASFSPDSRLLFVPSDGSGSSGFLSVWRADTEASALALSVVYQNNQSSPEGLPDEPDEDGDGDRVIRGLNGAWEAAPSRDGRWLFVTAAASLSAWRVNADTATLQQLAVYCQASECPGGTGGFGDTLRGMRNLVVSPDNRFVFAAARGGDQLSAWRVEEEGTLALIESEGSNLDDVTEVAVNPEGSLLFAGVSGRDALQIWNIAEDGQISHETEYNDNGEGSDRDGYNEIHGLEASPVQGDNLVFTAEIGDNNNIAVRRVNPSSRRLAESVLVAGQRGADTVTDLRYTGIDPTGSFLFVTARPRTGGILTVWRVEGIRRVLPDLAVSVPVTLNFPLNEDLLVEVTASQAGRTETAQTRLPTGSTTGAVAFSPGDLGSGGWQFAISSVSSDDAAADETRATVRIAQPTLSLAAPETFPAGLPLPLRLETEVSPGMEVQLMLTVTGEVSSFMRVLLLGAEETAAEVEIPFSALAAASGASSWSLTVEATPPHAVRGEEDISLGVMAGLPLLTLRPLGSRYGLAADVPIAVEASAAPSTEVTIMVAATRVDSQSSSVLPVPVMLGPSTLSAQASFPAGALAAGQWRFTATAEPSDILQVGREAVVTVASLTLDIMPLQPVYLMTSEVQVRIMSDGDPGSEVLLTATHEDGITTRQVAVRLPASITSTVIAFSGADMLDTAGLWTLAASAPGVTDILIGPSAQVRVLTTVIMVTLEAEPAALSPGETVTLTLSLDAPAPVPLALGVGVSVSDGSPRPDLEIAVPMDATSGSISYQLQGSAGTQMFTLRDLGLDFLSVVTPMTTVTVLPPALELLPQDENAPPVSAGSTLGVRISASHAPQTELAVTVQATRASTPLLQATTATAVVVLEAEETQVMVLFGGANALSPGQWILAITDVMPRAAAIASSTGLRVVVGPAALALSAPSELPLGLDAVIAVSASAALGQEVRVTMTATLDDGPVPASSQSIVLPPASLSAEAVFEADLLTPGSWRFAVVSVEPSSLTTDLGMEFPLVDFAAASSLVRQIALPVLILEMSPAPVEVGRDVPVVVRVSAAVPQMLQVTVTATQGSGDALRTRQTTLAQSSTMATVAFGVGGGDNDLSPGIWVLTATAAPPGAALASSPLTLSVPEASLRLERLGPVSVAAGTAVRVRITAEGGLLAPGLSLEVSANHLFIGSVRANAVVDESGQAEAEFPGLSPGEWLLSAVAAGQPSGGAADQVFVETFALTLMPRQPTVAATTAVVLFLGTPIPLGMEVSVEVTARSSSSLSELTKMVALAPDTTSTELVYEPGELTPGEWNFTVQASTSTRMVVNISAATATLQVGPAPLRLAALQERYPTTERVVISIMADVPPGRDVMVTVEASQADSGMMTSVTVVFQAEQTSAQAVFDAGQLEAGRWTFRVSRVSPEGFLNSVSTATANVVSPVLSLNLPRFNFLMTEPLETQVSLDIPPGTTVTVTVSAEPLDGRTGAEEVMVDLPADGRQSLAVFPANTLAAGSWSFIATGPALTSSTLGPVYVLTSPVTITSLTALPTQVLPDGELTLSVTLEAALQAFVDVQLTAMDPDARESTPVNIRIEGGDLSGSAAYNLSSRAGDWHFEVQTGTVVSGGATASATVRPPSLSLRAGPSPVSLGLPSSVFVMAEAPPYLDVQVTVRAVQTGEPMGSPRTATVVLAPLSTEVRADFEGGNALGLGAWELSISEVSPSTAVTASPDTVMLEVGLPQVSLAAPESVLWGSPVEIMVVSTAAPGGEVAVTIAASSQGREDESLTVMLGAMSTEVIAVFEFEGAQRLLTGEWNFSIRSEATGSVIFSTETVTVIVLPPVLTLLLPTAPVAPGDDVMVGIMANEAPGEEVRVRVVASRIVGETELVREAAATLSATDSATSALFRAGDNGLSPGVWSLALTTSLSLRSLVLPETPTVSVRLPQLTLERLGDREVAPGSVVAVQVSAEAPPAVPVVLTLRASQPGREERQESVELDGENLVQVVEFQGLPPGEWTFSAMAEPPELAPAGGATQTVVVRSIVLALQPGMPVLPAGSPVPIMVMSGTTEPGVDLGITVLANPLDGQDAAETITIFLAADASLATGEFAAGQLGPGSWAFSGTVSSAGVATVLPGGRVRLEPVLALAAVQEESTVRVTVTASAVPHTTVTVAVLATLAADSARTETASLALADNSMGAVTFGDAAALEPGLWLFTMTATPTEVVNTDAELEFTVLPALTLRLVGPAERSPRSPVRLALGVSHELSSEILLTVTASQEGAEPVQRDVTLERGAMDTEVLFEGDALSAGRWIFTATATPNDLLHTASARAEVLVRQALLELVAVSGALVLPGEMISFELRLTPALNTTVSVRVTAQREGRENSVVLERSLELAPGTSSLPFSVDTDDLGDGGGAGRWRFVAQSTSSGAVDDNGAEQAVAVGVITVSLSVPGLGEGEEVFPGDAAKLLLSASYEGDSLGFELPLAIEVAAADDSPRDSIIIQVSADTSMGSFSFIPDAVPGIWTFTAGGSRTVPEVATVAFMVSRVMSLDFSAPPSDGVRADDLTLLLRYLKLCVQGQNRLLPVNCDALGADDREINLARNLGEPAFYRFADLPALERLPDLTGNGTGDVDDLVVLLRALSGVRDSFLVPAAPRQAQDARLRMIRQLLERE